MSGRCKSCDAILTKVELQLTKDNGDVEDLCGDCRDDVYDDSYYHEFMFENLEEGVTRPRKIKYL